MIFIVDTNILLRLDHVGHPHRAIVQEAIERLVDEQHTIRTLPQVLYEYWVVATRPANLNGLGFSVADAELMMADHKELFPPLRDERGILERWENLVSHYQVLGKSAHDTRLVAAMLRHGITYLLTLNDGDFKRFGEITVFTPEAIISGQVSL